MSARRDPDASVICTSTRVAPARLARRSSVQLFTAGQRSATPAITVGRLVATASRRNSAGDGLVRRATDATTGACQRCEGGGPMLLKAPFGMIWAAKVWQVILPSRM